MMIALENGNYVNSAAVRLLIPQKSDKIRGHRTAIHLIGNSDFSIPYMASGTADGIADAINAQVIKAEPGYELVVVTHRRDDEFCFSRCPIIAWRVAGEGWPSPVTLADEGSLTEQEQAILCPGGLVEQQGCCSYPSLEEWEAGARKDWEEAHARWLAKNPKPEAAE